MVTISVGKRGLARSAKERASHLYKGPAAPYSLGRRDIYNKGLMLAIPDKVMRANKVKNILLVVEGLGGQKGKIHPKKGVAQ